MKVSEWKPAFPKPGKKRIRKDTVKVTDPENIIQGLAEQLCAVYGITFFRLPDVLMRAVYASDRVPIHQKKQISEYIKGFPDLVLFNPAINKYKAIEIKTEKGKLSDSQRHWQNHLNTIITIGWEQTKQEIMDFVNEE